MKDTLLATGRCDAAVALRRRFREREDDCNRGAVRLPVRTPSLGHPYWYRGSGFGDEAPKRCGGRNPPWPPRRGVNTTRESRFFFVGRIARRQGELD